jgi:hypothetical protein
MRVSFRTQAKNPEFHAADLTHNVVKQGPAAPILQKWLINRPHNPLCPRHAQLAAFEIGFTVNAIVVRTGKHEVIRQSRFNCGFLAQRLYEGASSTTTR